MCCGEMCGRGACVVGEMCGRGACVVGEMCGRGACVVGRCLLHFSPRRSCTMVSGLGHWLSANRFPWSSSKWTVSLMEFKITSFTVHAANGPLVRDSARSGFGEA